jgi:hypothetical protein
LRNLSQDQLGRLVHVSGDALSKIEKAQRWPPPGLAEACDTALATGGILARLLPLVEGQRRDSHGDVVDNRAARTVNSVSGTDVAAQLRTHGSGLLAPSAWITTQQLSDDDDEQDALELARRVAASDVGEETLSQLEAVVDDLAVAYPITPPRVLLGRIRRHLHYVYQLIEVRKNLTEHRRLLVVGGWLSLLGATVHIDLGQQEAATARLHTAASLSRHAGHDEIHAWCYETQAWRVLTDGDYPSAVELSRAAQKLAPSGSSVAVQAMAQEGRAWARLRQGDETYAAITKVHNLVSPMPKPAQPEHHYRYDPDKYVAYTATTLAWLGDPAAEGYAREVIARLSPSNEIEKWPRRVAVANLDLALALLVTNRLDEASDAALRAILSGRVVPSNHWRAAEVVKAVEAKGLPEATELREAYEMLRRGYQV